MSDPSSLFEKWKEAVSERDIALDHIHKMQVTNGSLTDTIDRLKAELEACIKERIYQAEKHDLWKTKYDETYIQVKCLRTERDYAQDQAEKLAEALRKISEYRFNDPGALAKAALADYEKGVYHVS